MLNELLVTFLMLFILTTIQAQNLEIEGKVKIAEMDLKNNADSIVVLLYDGILARRDVSTIKELPASPSIGDIVFYNGTNWIVLSPGVDGQILKLLGGIPTWRDKSCDLYLGQFYKGGYIFYLDGSGCHGLIAAPIDQSTSGAEWGCHGVGMNTNTALGTGQTNTTSIINGCSQNGIAARLCDDLVYGGYSDWFLPSRDELNLMWQNLADSDGNGNNSGPTDPNNIGDFSNSGYWSSSEYNINISWYQFFNDGAQASTNKTFLRRVRAVRAF